MAQGGESDGRRAGVPAGEAERSKRLAQALRANLKRRKEQARGRGAEAPSGDETRRGGS